MIAIDTSALMAIALNEPEADACSAALQAEEHLIISAGTVVEALIALSIVFVAFFASTAPPANGQVLYGGITGTVTDSTGAAVPGATVTITHKETNLSREAISNATGIFSLTNVQAGTYNVKVKTRVTDVAGNRFDAKRRPGLQPLVWTFEVG